MGSVTFDLEAASRGTSITNETSQRTVDGEMNRQTTISDRLDLSVEVEQLQARITRMNNITGMSESANLLIQRARLDLEIDFTRIDRFISNAEELEGISPDLLKEYLAIVKLLDKNTPAELDPFFDELETTLRQFADGDDSALERLRSVFVKVRVDVISISFTSEEQKGDPLLFDLDGDGLELTTADDGILFDLDADGKTDRTSAPAGGDAFLAIDRNGNNRIDDGRELFGDQNGARDGFAELARLDHNNDGWINNDDEDFNRLLLFDGHGLRSLSGAGITAISLAAKSVFEQINGNDVVGTADFVKNDGGRGTVSEALLAYK